MRRYLLLPLILLLFLAACADDDGDGAADPLSPEAPTAVTALDEPGDASPAATSSGRATLPPSFTPTATPQPTATRTPQPDTSPSLAPAAATQDATTVAALPTAPRPATELPLHLINLPPGFSIHVYAEGVDGARSMALAEDGTLFVGTRRPGIVYALRDRDGNQHAETLVTLATDLNSPNGVAYRDGSLYVAEIDRLIRMDNVLAHVDAGTMPTPVVVTTAFQPDDHHGWKYLRFGPDGMLYVPQGVPCNVCPEDPGYGTINRLNPDGSGFETVVRGVRNSVGFDWHPTTGELWFTDNGRDLMGDDIPPDELNRVRVEGTHYGFPYCHGGIVIDPQFGVSGACDLYEPPVQPLGPHVAALGMRFYTGDRFPAQYHGQPFIAEHGSWNRTVPIGYRVTLVRLDAAGNALEYTPFADGWLQDGRAWGRPVDVLVLPSGAMLVSDDFADAIYYIDYTG